MVFCPGGVSGGMAGSQVREVSDPSPQNVDGNKEGVAEKVQK